MQFSENTYQNDRHKTFYLSAGKENNKKIYFIHGWPELSISWRNQLGFFSDLGFHAIAPDMRGYGQSSVYSKHSDYAQQEIVKDMIDLHEHLGGGEAIWVGHDWGSPVVWNIASNHDEFVDKIISLCVPFRMQDSMISSIDRNLYPEDDFPYGQWEYQFYYRENFEEAQKQLEANTYNTVKCLFRSGSKDTLDKHAQTAFVRKNNGWFKDGVAPNIPLDENVLSEKEINFLTISSIFWLFSVYLYANYDYRNTILLLITPLLFDNKNKFKSKVIFIFILISPLPTDINFYILNLFTFLKAACFMYIFSIIIYDIFSFFAYTYGRLPRDRHIESH